jgi:hypothetical protein
MASPLKRPLLMGGKKLSVVITIRKTDILVVMQFAFFRRHRALKVKQSHYRSGQALRVPERLRLPDFKTSRHMKVVRLSALGTGRLYPQGSIPGTHFC